MYTLPFMSPFYLTWPEILSENTIVAWVRNLSFVLCLILSRAKIFGRMSLLAAVKEIRT